MPSAASVFNATSRSVPSPCERNSQYTIDLCTPHYESTPGAAEVPLSGTSLGVGEASSSGNVPATDSSGGGVADNRRRQS